MKIVLAEEKAGNAPEKSFQQEIIRVGRDTKDCQIVFDNTQFPMVSRRHAELRWTGGRWILFDLNSSYGTFIDGQKVTAPQPVAVGSRVQFGTQGPVLRVVWFETFSDSSDNFPAQNNFPQISPQFHPQSYADSLPPPAAGSMQKPDSVSFAPPENLPSTEVAHLKLVEENKLFPLTKKSVWLGRDTSCEIVMEASAVMISRKHAEIRRESSIFFIHDNGSFNGTLINSQRISAPTQLYHGDEIQLGMGAPVLQFNAPSRVAPKGASLAAQRSVPIGQSANFPDLAGQIAHTGSKTMVANMGNISQKISTEPSAKPQLLMQLVFGNKQQLTIGRADTSDIKLDGLQISNQHAKLLKTSGGVAIEDLGSTNGIYLNGQRVSRSLITPNDSVLIGSFLIQVDQAGNIGVFDTRSKTRIDSVNITKDVKNRAGGGMLRLLDNISLSIQPNEFVGLLGPSGAGKSTFMDALNGMRPASGGSVLINNLDLYEHLDSIKQSIGYVPQDDIIHRELTVYRTLYYVAKLRLSRDVSKSEINKIIDEVLDVTGLTERRNVAISQLSGGQRKRVSIAVELITKPSVIFLDEPTSGLDPATEEKIMTLFRQIAETGRTVILTTHAMENVKLFDKIVVLMRGKLVFYGRPDEALKHLNATSFKDLYDKLEEPVEQKLKQTNNGANRLQVTEQVAEEWKQKFTNTPQFKKNVYEPLKQIGKAQSGGVQKKGRLGIFGAIRQWLTLSRRYWEVLFRDKFTLFILLVQAPIIAVLTYFVMGENQPRDFAYFVLSLVAVWFGTSVSAREIIRERPVYSRERMVNLGILPYLASKLFVLGIIVGVQCFLLFAPLKILDITGLMPMPGVSFGIPQFFVMLLTAGVGIALGLLISALVKTSEMATSLVPLILIPQILFSGLVGVPSGRIDKAAGLLMPATWSFDTMKRYSTLDTLENDGAIKGQGLYKNIEAENNRIIADAKTDLEEYKKKSEEKLTDFENDVKSGKNVSAPTLDEPPKISDARKIPEDLSRYISFLHPWMHEILNQVVLMLMFFMLVIFTLIVLRFQDIG